MNRDFSNVSMAVIRRLPKYHRYLKDLLEKEVYRISSRELSKLIGFTASQIRQDLNCFGGFGQQGYGYNVEELYQEIGKILGLKKTYTTVIIGTGNLGQAIANYPSFNKYGFQLMALFDINPKLIGMKIRDIDILDLDYLEEFVSKNKVEIGIMEMEEQVLSLEALMCQEEVYSNPEKSRDVQHQVSSLKEQINLLYEEWENAIDISS